MPVLLQSLFSLRLPKGAIWLPQTISVLSFGNYQDQIVPPFQVKPSRIKFPKGEEWVGGGGVASFFNDLRQTNGKKKLKGSLALMVGRALKPASAGADTSTKVTAVEIRIVLSSPESVCNKKPGCCKPCGPCYQDNKDIFHPLPHWPLLVIQKSDKYVED